MLEARGGMRRVTRAAVAVALVACSAVYPEIDTPRRPAGASEKLDPPPPRNLLFIEIEGATIPSDEGRKERWGEVGTAEVDCFVIVFQDDVEIYRTGVVRNSLAPTWDGTGQNFVVPLDAELRFELWDKATLTQYPLCRRAVLDPLDEQIWGENELLCDNGSVIRVTLDRAQAQTGLGFSYELRSQVVAVTRVDPIGPAGRAGLTVGDKVLTVQDQPVRGLDEAKVRSLINAAAKQGVRLTLERKGEPVTLEFREGPIYPVAPGTDVTGLVAADYGLLEDPAEWSGSDATPPASDEPPVSGSAAPPASAGPPAGGAPKDAAPAGSGAPSKPAPAPATPDDEVDLSLIEGGGGVIDLD